MRDRARDEQLRAWINAGEADRTPQHTDVIMWGVWFSVNGDEYTPPDAMLPTQEEADTYAREAGQQEWAVSPCLLSMKTRDDYRIPPASAP